jgi:hypothetical protein
MYTPDWTVPENVEVLDDGRIFRHGSRRCRRDNETQSGQTGAISPTNRRRRMPGRNRPGAIFSTDVRAAYF